MGVAKVKSGAKVGWETCMALVKAEVVKRIRAPEALLVTLVGRVSSSTRLLPVASAAHTFVPLTTPCPGARICNWIAWAAGLPFKLPTTCSTFMRWKLAKVAGAKTKEPMTMAPSPNFPRNQPERSVRGSIGEHGALGCRVHFGEGCGEFVSQLLSKDTIYR